MRKTIITALLTLVLGSASLASQAQDVDFNNVLPRPNSVQAASDKTFVINAETRICYGKGKAAKRSALFLQQYIKERTGLTLAVTKRMPAANAISLATAPASGMDPEGYKLTVDDASISICGGSDAGLFYGVQTLRKALPHSLINPQSPRLKTERTIHVPYGTVTDAPRFSYRGAHLDVSRHFVTTDSIRRFIDMLALHNINRLHWHLTDDQGWRIEIKKYPRLTTVGSRRAETVIGRNSGRYDGQPYGGFYTQKECRDIVKYAAERNITIVPEIDMPGHMLGALAAYPELGCNGGPYEVWRQWGISDDVLCAGNDRTLRFIDDVLDEIVRVFPSQYIHVGGDECPKTVWKTCPKCQARIKAEGLEARDGHSAEERLQSYVIRHAEAHLAKLGRRMIGWDETLEGGLADGATVMSWRGEAGGIEAARQHHDVVMTPNTYLYFDYYQSLNTDTEPLAIGGYLPLQRVYGYEPVNDAMLAEGLDKYIVGVQANCWTEYMPTYRQIEYMELPRLAALAEIQWTARGTKDYEAFLRRALHLMNLYDEQGYNYAKHIYDVRTTHNVDTSAHRVTASLTSALPTEIRYTLDGSEPDRTSPLYDEPIVIDSDCTLRACTYRPVERRANSVATRYERSNIDATDFHVTKATACPTTLLTTPDAKYACEGGLTLVDGVHGTRATFASGQWVGFNGEDLDIIIDLGTAQPVSEVSINTYVGKVDWIFNCRGMSVETSTDGSAYTAAAADTYPADAQDTPDGIRTHTVSFAPTEARYVRVKALCEKSIPQWHSGRGLGGFLFVDEVAVR